jgi:hypothetical protein
METMVFMSNFRNAFFPAVAAATLIYAVGCGQNDKTAAPPTIAVSTPKPAPSSSETSSPATVGSTSTNSIYPAPKAVPVLSGTSAEKPKSAISSTGQSSKSKQTASKTKQSHPSAAAAKNPLVGSWMGTLSEPTGYKPGEMTVTYNPDGTMLQTSTVLSSDPAMAATRDIHLIVHATYKIEGNHVIAKATSLTNNGVKTDTPSPTLTQSFKIDGDTLTLGQIGGTGKNILKKQK